MRLHSDIKYRKPVVEKLHSGALCHFTYLQTSVDCAEVFCITCVSNMAPCAMPDASNCTLVCQPRLLFLSTSCLFWAVTEDSRPHCHSKHSSFNSVAIAIRMRLMWCTPYTMCCIPACNLIHFRHQTLVIISAVLIVAVLFECRTLGQ